MKELLKQIGKSLVIMRQEREGDIRQSVLLVDGSFILPNNFVLIIKGLRENLETPDL